MPSFTVIKPPLCSCPVLRVACCGDDDGPIDLPAEFAKWNEGGKLRIVGKPEELRMAGVRSVTTFYVEAKDGRKE